MQWFAQLAGDWNPRDLRDGGGYAELLAALLSPGAGPGDIWFNHKPREEEPERDLPPPVPARPAGAAHPSASARQGRGPAPPAPAPQQHRPGAGGPRPLHLFFQPLRPQRRQPGRGTGPPAGRRTEEPALDHLLPVHPQRPGGDLGLLQDAGRPQAQPTAAIADGGVPGPRAPALEGGPGAAQRLRHGRQRDPALVPHPAHAHAAPADRRAPLASPAS